MAKQNSTSEIVTLNTICNSFPVPVQANISRDVFLGTIETLFDTKSIVIVEGGEGIGKTTLLSQFAASYPHHAISLFIRPTSKYTYDYDVLVLDLANQISWILDEQELDPMQEVPDGMLRQYTFALGRRAIRKSETYYFVIDGLFDIPEMDSLSREQILDLLPLGHRNFKFLLSSRTDSVSFKGISPDIVKSMLLGGFSLDQTKRFFAEVSLADDDIDYVHRLFGKNPSYLASVRRIINTGIGVEALFSDLPGNLPHLFELEWKNVSDDNNEQLVLSLIAHDTRRHTAEEISQLTDIEINKIREILHKHSFISIASDGVSYISEAMRRFAIGKVKYSKDHVIDLIIKKLMTSNHEEASLKLANSLPSYLYEGNRLNELIEYLSDNYFTDALMASQSISFIRKMAALGFDTAKELNDELSIIRFSFYTTLIAELTIAETWRSEVEALMELDDYEGALSLAHSAKLKEDRLHLLAVIARKKREQDDIPEPELLEEMRNLHQQIDYSGLSDERSSEIAIDVLYSSPDTAIEIIERSQDVGGEYDALDWALARLSFEAIRSQDDDNASENIRSRIKNPSVRRLSDEISLMLKDYTSDEVIEEIEKLDQVTDKLYLLRHWTVTNRTDEKVAEVIEYAFNLTLQSTAYTPNARLFRELASPLPNIADTSKLQNLIAKFDGQKAFCEQYGPTEDYVRLQLIIARAEFKLDEASAENRILEVYYFISSLQDYLVKSECMSRLLAALILIDLPDLFDQKHGLYTVATDDLKQYFEKLMDSTADQYAASKRIIQALAKRLPDLAVEFSNSLNTSDRRNEALQGVFNALLDTSDDLLNVQVLEDVLSKITDQDLQDDCIVSGLQRLARVEIVDFNIYIAAKNIMNAVPALKDAGQRCQALCFIFQFHDTQGQDIDKILSFDIFSLLSNSYHSIDVLWHKVDIGFQIAQAVTKYSAELGQEYLNSSQRYKRESSLCNSTLAYAYIGCIKLGITAFSGMLSNEIMSDEDLEYLGNLINRLPSSGERAELWSDLAIHHFLNHSTALVSAKSA